MTEATATPDEETFDEETFDEETFDEEPLDPDEERELREATEADKRQEEDYWFGD